MTLSLKPRLDTSSRKEAWLAQVGQLVSQLSAWSSELGWAVEMASATAHDPPAGEYEVPVLRVRMPDGELRVQPISMLVYGGAGRVDLEGYPTLSRVKLIPADGGWRIMTDSNVPLRVPWSRDSFAQLASDLVA